MPVEVPVPVAVPVFVPVPVGAPLPSPAPAAHPAPVPPAAPPAAHPEDDADMPAAEEEEEVGGGRDALLLLNRPPDEEVYTVHVTGGRISVMGDGRFVAFCNREAHRGPNGEPCSTTRSSIMVENKLSSGRPVGTLGCWLEDETTADGYMHQEWVYQFSKRARVKKRHEIMALPMGPTLCNCERRRGTPEERWARLGAEDIEPTRPAWP